MQQLTTPHVVNKVRSNQKDETQQPKTHLTVSRKTDPIAQKSKIELLVPASSPICGEYSSGQSAPIAHSVAKI